MTVDLPDSDERSRQETQRSPELKSTATQWNGLLVLVKSIIRRRLTRKQKWILCIIACYLLTDLRLFLSVPNLVLFLWSEHVHEDDSLRLEVNVFPKISIRGDPVFAVVSETNLSATPVEAMSPYGRDYDRSGLYREFQVSGSSPRGRVVETFDWGVYGILGGGLGGLVMLKQDESVSKAISLSKYARFDEVGLYRLDFGFNQFNLGEFNLFMIPENPVSRWFKETLGILLLKIPVDAFSEWGAILLGYQGDRRSLCALVKYYLDHESRRGSGNTVGECLRGILKNDDPAMVGSAVSNYWNRSPDKAESLLGMYFISHAIGRFAGLGYPIAGKEHYAERLTDSVYSKLSAERQGELRKSVARHRSFETDSYLRERLDAAQARLAESTREEEKYSLEHAMKHYFEVLNATDERQVILERFDLLLKHMRRHRE